jgi:hypothetical protein
MDTKEVMRISGQVVNQFDYEYYYYGQDSRQSAKFSEVEGAVGCSTAGLNIQPDNR